jgi:hypothetical protein
LILDLKELRPKPNPFGAMNNGTLSLNPSAPAPFRLPDNTPFGPFSFTNTNPPPLRMKKTEEKEHESTTVPSLFVNSTTSNTM